MVIIDLIKMMTQNVNAEDTNETAASVPPKLPLQMRSMLDLQMHPRVHLQMSPRTLQKCASSAAQNAKEGSDVSFNIKILQMKRPQLVMRHQRSHLLTKNFFNLKIEFY